MQLRVNAKRRETSRTIRGLIELRTARLDTVPNIYTTALIELRIGPRDGIKYSGEDIIADPEIEGLKVDGKGFYSKDGYRAGVSVDAEGW